MKRNTRNKIIGVVLVLVALGFAAWMYWQRNNGPEVQQQEVLQPVAMKKTKLGKMSCVAPLAERSQQMGVRKRVVRFPKRSN